MAENKLTKTSESKRTFEEVFAATNKKNPKHEDIVALRKMMNEDDTIWQNYGDWAKQTESVILSEYFETSGLLLETIKKRLIELRKELDWENAGVLEKLLIRQICLTYLRLYYVERQHHQATSGSHSLTQGVYWDKRLSEAQKRHLKAIESLAKVRKMMAQTSKFETAASKARSVQTLNSLKILKEMTTSNN